MAEEDGTVVAGTEAMAVAGMAGMAVAGTAGMVVAGMAEVGGMEAVTGPGTGVLVIRILIGAGMAVVTDGVGAAADTGVVVTTEAGAAVITEAGVTGVSRNRFRSSRTLFPVTRVG
jgi:hypothetical protein